jgi:hypothetical protein
MTLDAGYPTCGHIAPFGLDAYKIPVEPNVLAASFLLNWRKAESQMELSLHSPGGNEITSQSSTSYERGQTTKSYNISNPEPGLWVVEVRSGGLAKEGEGYCLSANLAVGEAKKGDDAHLNGIIRDLTQEYGITLAVGVDVKKTGTYEIIGSFLELKNNFETSVSTRKVLGFGSRIVNLRLENATSPGPYRLTELKLLDEEGYEIDQSKANFTTKADNYLQDQEAGITGNYSDYGLDLNGDGLFEYLTVDIEIEVIKAGNYSLMANLCDINGREIVWSADYENLSSGNHIMHLDFDGKSIERHNVNGPYHLEDLVLIRGESEQEYFAQQVMVEEACITRAYNSTQFGDSS